MGGIAFYASAGPELNQYDIDVEAATLVKRSSVRLPANVQYAWQHTSQPYFYVASSDTRPGALSSPADDLLPHYLSAFRIEASGALTAHGAPVKLQRRPIHLSTDIPSQYLLMAYNDPANLTVHKINADGTLGDQVKQSDSLNFGFYPHQVRVSPSNKVAILVTRGRNPAGGKPEEPGAIKVFKYRNGVLSDEISIAPNGGYGFGPRHLNFHPTQPWIYVSLERQHQMTLFSFDNDTLSDGPLYSKGLLADPHERPGQMAGTVHVHPNGCFVYGVERASVEIQGKTYFRGGENTILAFAIDERTGEPNLIQRITTCGLHPRTFSIDPSGRLLIAANISPVEIEEGGAKRIVPASLDLFRIGADGRLAYVRKYEVDTGTAMMFWSGLARL